MLAERRFSPTAISIACVLAALVLFASLFWASYRHRGWWAAPAKTVSAARSSTSPSRKTAHVDSSGGDDLSNAQNAILFSIAPLTSLSAMTTPGDPDPVASFRQLIVLPHDTARETPHIDPRRMRTIVDRGVVRY